MRRIAWAWAFWGLLLSISVAGSLRAQTPNPTVNPFETKALAPLAGPQYTPAPGQSSIGFYGTDLGTTTVHDGQLVILFGDTWSSATNPTIGPIGDDSQGTICLSPIGCPLGGFPVPNGEVLEAFIDADPNEPFFERAGPPLVFRRNAFGLVAPQPVYDGGWITGSILTMREFKVGGAPFSNGKPGLAGGLFAFFARGEGVPCTSGICPHGFTCDLAMGINERDEICADDAPPCPPGDPLCVPCPNDASQGVCIDTNSPRYTAGNFFERSRGAAAFVRIGNADRVIEEQYYTRTWPTHRFRNLSAVTVDNYVIVAGVGQPTVPDARPVNGFTTGQEKVFVFGRPSIAGIRGETAKLYLAVVDVPSYSSTASFPWQPRYYAGHVNGAPTFSSLESDAKALPDTNGSEEEALDVTNQHTVRFVPELDKWVMLYGGDLPEPLFLELATGFQGSQVVRDPFGSIYIRFADEPWGPWSPPVPLLLGGQREVGGNEYAAGGIMYHPSCTPAPECLPGEPIPNLETDEDPNNDREFAGFLYGVNLIPEWTVDHGPTVEIYWNVSTGAPYQSVLMRSTLHR